ncbi:hypothetical protein L596_015998 [Steinernema carpocapsae]|nr:hypothetical protein L596_015998 [Steinernema carpocapsae]
MSSKTYNLHKMFTISSIFVVCAPVVMGILPNVAFLAFMYLNIGASESFPRVCISMIATLPIWHCVIVVVTVKPYRIAFLKMFGCFRFMNVGNVVSSVRVGSTSSGW